MRQVPLQVLSERSAEAQAAGQSNADQPYVAVSVAADLKQVYSALQVSSCVFLVVMVFCAQCANFFLRSPHVPCLFLVSILTSVYFVWPIGKTCKV